MHSVYSDGATKISHPNAALAALKPCPAQEPQVDCSCHGLTDICDKGVSINYWAGMQTVDAMYVLQDSLSFPISLVTTHGWKHFAPTWSASVVIKRDERS